MKEISEVTQMIEKHRVLFVRGQRFLMVVTKSCTVHKTFQCTSLI